MKHKIGIIDYSSSNLISLSKCLENLKFDFIISNNSKRLNACDVLILPGVGTFENVMNFLKKNKLDKFIITFSKNKTKKIIGICIGMQILALKGNETKNKKFTNGLGLISAITDKLDNFHIGWNKVKTIKFLEDKYSNKYFFFNHSFVLKNIKNKISYGTFFFKKLKYPSIVRNNNIFGFQFHPEKSHKIGSEILESVINYEN